MAVHASREKGVGHGCWVRACLREIERKGRRFGQPVLKKTNKNLAKIRI
jgi:hypothetical protein